MIFKVRIKALDSLVALEPEKNDKKTRHFVNTCIQNKIMCKIISEQRTRERITKSISTKRKVPLTREREGRDQSTVNANDETNNSSNWLIRLEQETKLFPSLLLGEKKKPKESSSRSKGTKKREDLRNKKRD